MLTESAEEKIVANQTKDHAAIFQVVGSASVMALDGAELWNTLPSEN
jgi:hypothetical protein